jgi:glycosyl-4,4'-diaponeurosporenoate acyltransferase
VARAGDRRPPRGDPVSALPLVFELSDPGILLANVAGAGAAHALTGYAAHRRPASRLERDGALLRVRPGERRLHRALRVRHWKDRLPEAGALFAGGISKRRLPPELETFARETRRAELAHWWAMACAPVFLLWNPPLGAALMALYSVLVNAPFILVQRYNRARVQRILARRAAQTWRSSGSSRRADGRPGRRTSGSSMP